AEYDPNTITLGDFDRRTRNAAVVPPRIDDFSRQEFRAYDFSHEKKFLDAVDQAEWQLRHVRRFDGHRRSRNRFMLMRILRRRTFRIGRCLMLVLAGCASRHLMLLFMLCQNLAPSKHARADRCDDLTQKTSAIAHVFFLTI